MTERRFQCLRPVQTVIPFLDPDEPLSQPHCWAYPDMLEIGLVEEPVAGSLSWGRAHFGAWCIVSSPLYAQYTLPHSV
jgi:hypothetical protein